MMIPTWQVVLHDGTVFRVPESNLDAFLHVLTFNKCEFDVRREPDPFAAPNGPVSEEKP